MSRLNIKKISALAMAAAVMAQLTACGENTTWGAEIDGVRIPAGVFIYYLETAYYDARSNVSEENPDAGAAAEQDLFASQIDGRSASDWICDEASKYMREYAAIEAKFDEYGLSVDSDTKDYIKNYCNQFWEYAGGYYAQMGISQRSYESIFLNGEKRNLLFDALYSEGGDYAVSDDEMRSYLDDKYVMINYIEMELKDGEGNLLKSDGKAERRAMAEEYIERYKNGEDFDSLNAEYVTYYQNLQAAAAEAAEDNDEALTAEVNGSEANAPLETDEDLLPDDDETAEDSEASEDEGDAEAETDGDSEAEAADDKTDDAQADEPEDEADNDDNAAEDGDEPAGAVIDPANVQVNAVPSNKTVVDRDTTAPSAEVVEAAFEMNKGDIRIVETADGEHYYVVLKMDILETDEYLDAARNSLLYEMRSDDYSELITQWTKSQLFNKNLEAYERYAPEKIFAE